MSWAVTLGLLAGEVLAALLLGLVWFCAVTWAARLIVRAVDGRAPQQGKKERPSPVLEHQRRQLNDRRITLHRLSVYQSIRK